MPHVLTELNASRQHAVSDAPDGQIGARTPALSAPRSIAWMYVVIGALVLAMVMVGYWGWLEMVNAGDQSALLSRMIENRNAMRAEAQTATPTEAAPPTAYAKAMTAVPASYAPARGSASYDTGTGPADAPAQSVRIIAPKYATSFGCMNVATGAEQLICSDMELTQLDLDLYVALSNSMARRGDKEQPTREQLEWINGSRNACSDKDCMLAAYKLRISELSR